MPFAFRIIPAHLPHTRRYQLFQLLFVLDIGGNILGFQAKDGGIPFGKYPRLVFPQVRLNKVLADQILFLHKVPVHNEKAAFPLSQGVGQPVKMGGNMSASPSCSQHYDLDWAILGKFHAAIAPFHEYPSSSLVMGKDSSISCTRLLHQLGNSLGTPSSTSPGWRDRKVPPLQMRADTSGKY